MTMPYRATWVPAVVASTLASGAGFAMRFGVTAAAAQDSSFWSFLKEGKTIRRCTPMTAAHLEAKASLARPNDRNGQSRRRRPARSRAERPSQAAQN